MRDPDASIARRRHAAHGGDALSSPSPPIVCSCTPGFPLPVTPWRLCPTCTPLGITHYYASPFLQACSGGVRTAMTLRTIRPLMLRSARRQTMRPSARTPGPRYGADPGHCAQPHGRDGHQRLVARRARKGTGLALCRLFDMPGTPQPASSCTARYSSPPWANRMARRPNPRRSARSTRPGRLQCTISSHCFPRHSAQLRLDPGTPP